MMHFVLLRKCTDLLRTLFTVKIIRKETRRTIPNITPIVTAAVFTVCGALAISVELNADGVMKVVAVKTLLLVVVVVAVVIVVVVEIGLVVVVVDVRFDA